MKAFNRSGILYSIFLSACCLSCNKLVEIPQPSNTIAAQATFKNDANATAAITAIYSDITAGGPFVNLSFGNGAATVFSGLGADELVDQTYTFPQFQNNAIPATDYIVNSSIWTPAYYDIYMTNAAIEGIQASNGISPGTKNQLTGEAKFLRAFCHFYLVNLFGDVPLVTQSDWSKINLLSRTPAKQVYQQIINDLKDAQSLLPKDYTISNGQRIRANYYAATALLARVYLYTRDWASAEAQTAAVINSGTYSLQTDLNTVFLKSSNEAILQWQTINSPPYAIQETQQILPYNSAGPPFTTISDQLFNAFELNDKRKAAWVNSVNLYGSTYNYPYKYKIRTGANNGINEYYMVLRFAEQYLIRAEAKAQQGTDLTGAIADLNLIRARAGLTPLSTTLNQTQVLAAVAQERRIELFAEFGHRWFDLIRTGQATNVLTAYKGYTVTANMLLYPIPDVERRRDPNLTQNPGY